MQTQISVVKLVEGWDMRGIHKLRLSRGAKALEPRTCIVAFNRAETIAMIVDANGGVYHSYEPDGFDLRILAENIQLGLAVVLVDKSRASRRRVQGVGSRLRRAA
ncbi:hypothetical protein LCGC14_2308620 [marine sediment metagenome]|uniref:Uncharacterized protein n=1 Tax=marine sediment metagenome TaxID=412755 RepID=A0A0F9FG63_9ZZZZ